MAFCWCSAWTGSVCDNEGRSLGAQLGLVLQRRV